MNKFCQHCGEEQDESNEICVKCGKIPFQNIQQVEEFNDINQKDDSDLETGVKVISFCFPIVGGILWLVHMNKAPKKSKAACVSAVWGIVIGIIINILSTIAQL